MDKNIKFLQRLLPIAFFIFIFMILQLIIPTATSQTQEHFIFLPTIVNPLIVIDPPYDMVLFLANETEGFGTLYEVQHSNGSQTRHQTQIEPYRFYHTKGNELSSEWEELWHKNGFIYRGTDTSPGSGLYYTLRDDNQYGSKWIPRYWDVGDIYERSPDVTFYNKEDCSPQFGGVQRTWLKFEAYYPTYTFPSSITLNHVIELAWLLNPHDEPTERYFYAQGYGLVKWESSDGRGSSYISEIHAPASRPNNTREIIPCLNTSAIVPAGLPKPTIYAK